MPTNDPALRAKIDAAKFSTPSLELASIFNPDVVAGLQQEVRELNDERAKLQRELTKVRGELSETRKERDTLLRERKTLKNICREMQSAVIDLNGAPRTLFDVYEKSDYRELCSERREVTCGGGCPRVADPADREVFDAR